MFEAERESSASMPSICTEWIGEVGHLPRDSSFKRVWTMSQHNRKQDARGEVLIALLREKSDFAIRRDQGWYRIPMASTPNRWPPKYLAFYQPRVFNEEAYLVKYYGAIDQIQVVPRSELFPNEFESSRSDRLYHKLSLKSLECLDVPIRSLRPRRLVFIPTTFEKFCRAEQINDLFDDSPLEDELWRHLKRLSIKAERQWILKLDSLRFFLDFALFCTKAPIAVETDGDSWHIDLERANDDYIRQNAIESHGWHVLRFNTKEIREGMESYCLPEIQKIMNTLGGLVDEGLVPRKFFPKSGATQYSLFERSAPYSVDIDAEENLELI
jgi:very-short-patch-repair endonuclease